jgi:hypothetical protein
MRWTRGVRQPDPRDDRTRRMGLSHHRYRARRSTASPPRPKGRERVPDARASAPRPHWGSMMQQPERPLTAAARDRALAFRRRLITTIAVSGAAAVAALGLLAEHTHAGTAVAAASSTTASSSSTATSAPSASASSTASTPTSSASLSPSGTVSSGNSSSATIVTGGS